MSHFCERFCVFRHPPRRDVTFQCAVLCLLAFQVAQCHTFAKGFVSFGISCGAMSRSVARFCVFGHISILDDTNRAIRSDGLWAQPSGHWVVSHICGRGSKRATTFVVTSRHRQPHLWLKILVLGLEQAISLQFES